MARSRDTDKAAVIGLLKAADHLRRFYATLFAPHDLTLQQYNVLRILRGAAPDGLPTLTITERMLEQTPGITRLIDRLVKKGWVERCAGDGDRRLVVCRITPAGKRLLVRLDRAVDRADRAALAPLGARDKARLVTLLDPLLREPC